MISLQKTFHGWKACSGRLTVFVWNDIYLQERQILSTGEGEKWSEDEGTWSWGKENGRRQKKTYVKGELFDRLLVQYLRVI